MVRKTKLKKLCMGIMAASVSITSLAPVSSIEVQAEEAATIHSMDYKDGPTLTASGMTEASYGFQMPTFNGGENSWSDVVNDLGVKVKINGNWVDIDSVDEFVYNSNWGH